jgi:hypothetical protein
MWDITLKINKRENFEDIIIFNFKNNFYVSVMVHQVHGNGIPARTQQGVPLPLPRG